MKESRMLVSLAIGGLAIVNLALGAALYVRTAEPRAYAQAAAVTLRPNVIAVGARYNNAGAIYMLDTSSGQLVLMRPDANGTAVKIIDSHNVADDVARIR